MSDTKRIQLQSVALNNPTVKKQEKSKPPPSYCFRFDLKLSDSNEQGYPEFNYASLLKTAQKKHEREKKKEKSNANPTLNPYDDDDDEDEVKRITKRLEEKYGKAKHKSGNIDLGAGYDESDSFIDNTDAYDEIVPDEVTPVLGGFYINSGPLEFKNADNFVEKKREEGGEDDDDKEDSEDSNDESDDENDDSEESESSEEGSEHETNKKVSKKISSSSSDVEDNTEPPKLKPAVLDPAAMDVD